MIDIIARELALQPHVEPRSRLLAVLAVLAASRGVPRAEPPAEPRSRFGLDGVAGLGAYELIGASLRFEQPITGSDMLTVRAGHLQLRSIYSDTNELYPVYIAHGGYRHYGAWLYLAVEGGVILGNDGRGRTAGPSGALTVGGKLRRTGVEALAADADVGVRARRAGRLGLRHVVTSIAAGRRPPRARDLAGSRVCGWWSGDYDNDPPVIAMPACESALAIGQNTFRITSGSTADDVHIGFVQVRCRP
jgi:hypothetical protein